MGKYIFLIDIKRFTNENTKYYLGNSAALHDLFHHNKNQFLLFQKTINNKAMEE